MHIRKTCISFLLAVLFILASALPALALNVDDHPADEYEYTDTIQPWFNGRTGLLDSITYNVTNTGATSGIRYRTKEITFEVAGLYSGSIDASALRKAPPQPGQKTVSVITISVDDLADVLGVNKDNPQEMADFKNLVSQPGKLNIGAVIEIYNAATGQVLDTISSPDQIDPVTSKYGFDRGSVEDMHNRYKGDIVSQVYNPLPGNNNPPPSPVNVTTGSGNLTLQAYSQAGQDVYGNEVPSIPRDPGTAKLSDTVKATLKIPEPSLPQSLQRLGAVIDQWRVDGATLTYPKRNPEFTFGHPTPPPVGTVTINMDYPGGQIDGGTGSVEATASFREDWSAAGAPIFDNIAGEMAPGPTEYPITAEYKVTVHYHYFVQEEGDSKPTRVDGDITVSGSATANLLVNGTGVNSL